MEIFQNREEGGVRLSERLNHYRRHPEAIVIGLPRGGVITAAAVARSLELPLDVIVVRKVGCPGNPELAVGAIMEDGTEVLNEEMLERLGLSRRDIALTIEEEQLEARRRLKVYRGQRPPLVLKDRVTLLVDDGIATGATMRAAIASARRHGAQRIIVAAPVMPRDTFYEMEDLADEVVCVSTPDIFWGIGGFYRSFDQATDEEVISQLEQPT